MAFKQNGITQPVSDLRDIRYTKRDFASFKAEMNAKLRQYFPESSSDFSESSGTQILLELVSNASDVLNYYLDKTFNESLLERSFEPRNIWSVSKGLGYQPSPLRPSIATLNMTIDLPVTGSLTSMFYFNIENDTVFSTKAPASVSFEMLEPLIFNAETDSLFSPKVITRNDGITVTRLTRNDVKVISGESNSDSHFFDSAPGFKRFHIPENKFINSIISIEDVDGNKWYQVRNLAEEFIFTGIPNISADDTTEVPFILTVKRVPYRYTVEYNFDGSCDIMFGSGDLDVGATEEIINPVNLIFPNKTQGKFKNFTPDQVDFNDFLNTTSLGVSPQNVYLIVKYRTGGGTAHNIDAGLITQIQNLDISFYSQRLTATAMDFVRNNISLTNPERAQGGAEAETIDQIKRNAPSSFASQLRAVSVQDYVGRIATLPVEYGSVYKMIARHSKNQSIDVINQLTNKVSQLVSQRANGQSDDILKQQIISLNESIKNTASDVIIYAITKDSNGFLQKPTITLKQNILTYMNQFKVISDTIDIQPVKIINVGCRFSLNCDVRRFKPGEVLINAAEFMKNYLALNNMDIGKDINLDDILTQLRANVKGIISVPEIAFVLLNGNTVDGRTYSNDYFGTIDQFMNFNGTILSVPADSMVEVKYPSIDIVGRFLN